MANVFYPDAWKDSIHQIDFQKLYDQGYRGILFDIDNTLVEHGAPATPEIIQFFENLRRIGLKSCVISNNKEPRVKSFADAVGCEYVFKANKPMKRGYLKGMEYMGTTVWNTVFVGDQLFTDVWGAKRVGIVSILTKPINPKEEIQIVLKRFLEYPILLCYQRYRKRHKETLL